GSRDAECGLEASPDISQSAIRNPHSAPAVQLFVERARAVEGGFELTAGNAAAVARVCRQLDGIPLAIELAAARVRALPVEQLAKRLEASFRLLSGGGAGSPARHETLAATFDWSWELLSEAERVLLRRLAVFAGGWTLEAAEVVCGEEWTNGRADEWKRPNLSGASTRP